MPTEVEMSPGKVASAIFSVLTNHGFSFQREAVMEPLHKDLCKLIFGDDWETPVLTSVVLSREQIDTMTLQCAIELRRARVGDVYLVFNEQLNALKMLLRAAISRMGYALTEQDADAFRAWIDYDLYAELNSAAREIDS